MPPTLVADLLQTLIAHDVLVSPDLETSIPKSTGSKLKAHVQWIWHPQGYWILRNSEDVTFLQVSDRDKRIIEQLTFFSPADVVKRYAVPANELQRLLSLLTATGMLEGTKPAQPARRKFTPLQLLYFPDSLVAIHELGHAFTLKHYGGMHLNFPSTA